MNKIKYLLLFLSMIGAQAESTKFLLLCGPSGIGKSTLIKELQKLDERFVYIKPFTTRPLREGETDKISITLENIQELESQNRLIALNYIYGNYYATPLDPIMEALDAQKIPVLDWPIEKVSSLRARLGDRVISYYLFVKDDHQLAARLNRDGRDRDGERLLKGQQELASFFAGEFEGEIDCAFENDHCEIYETARLIYLSYLEAIE